MSLHENRETFLDINTIDFTKMKKLHKEINEYNIRCMKEKWDPERDDNREPGFDGDCFAHCSEYEICFEAFFDLRCRKEDG